MKDAREFLNTARYRKKKKSSVSNSRKRSDHKHNYTACILKEKNRHYLANYCTTCGRIYDVNIIPLLNDEIDQKNTEYSVFEVNSIFQPFLERREI